MNASAVTEAPRDVQLTGAAIILLIIGSLGPWATFAGLDIGGADAGKDGILTLMLALVAGAILGYTHVKDLHTRGFRIGLVVAGALALLIAIVDFQDVSTIDSGVFEVSVGWGLWLTLVASIALTVMAVKRLRSND